MGIPFSLTFKQGHRFINISDFFETEKEEVPSANIIVENVPLTVLFESADPDARFYMDGLDAVPAKELKEDAETGDVYLSPSHYPVSLYENKADYYPFIPGYYRIEVLIRGKWVYAWLTVRPKQVDQVSWEEMRDEIESTLTGLAKDYTRESTGIPAVSMELSQSLALIQQWYSAIFSAIDDIVRWPQRCVVKSYQSIQIGRSAVIDKVTIRERCRHPENIRVIKIPKNKSTYDLEENRLLKWVVKALRHHLTELLKGIEELQINRRGEPNTRTGMVLETAGERSVSFKEALKMIINLLKALHRLESTLWMSEVGEISHSVPALMMLSDNRYRLVHQFYKCFTHEDQQKELIYYQWKRTDKLYEIWGFIKLLKLMGKDGMGFKPVQGWLFDGARSLTPELPAGTRIWFEKDPLTIQLVYDHKIPRKSTNTVSGDEPLFITHGHNRPDTRLDFFLQDIYIGSLLIDFKYRPRVYLWQDAMIEASVRPKVMAQLIDYGNSCRSNFLFAQDQDRAGRFRDIPPVLEAWAIYPDQVQTGMTTTNEDYRIRLIEMTPGKPMGHIIGEIKHYTERLIARYSWFVKN